jgi:hypothetical protein
MGRLCALLLLGAALLACDPEGNKECAWVLEPEPDLRGTTEAEMIPVCARNRDKNKQDCRLQTTLAFAKKVFEKKFRYVDLEVKSPGIPRTVTAIKFCDNSVERP